LSPIGFPDEAALHELVERSPELLPLAGAPRLVVIGREVPLGGGYADLLAAEPSGRLAIIEVKLARNAEARRAVVAQVLAYAAFLKGTEPGELEAQVLRSSLLRLGYTSVSDAVERADPDGSFDPGRFAEGLADSLATGSFRLVLVLDDASMELVRLVGYLESVAPELVTDLVTVSSYEVDGSRVLVPQRVDPERTEFAVADRAASRPQNTPSRGHLIPHEEFEAGIAGAPANARPALDRMYAWARELEARGLVRLLAFQGATGRTTLLPYVPNEDAGLVTIWNDNGFYVSFWRSVFERRAPESISRIEALLLPVTLGRGNTVKEVSDELLAALTSAYEQASP
jgi:hypothetical protein